MQEGGGGFGNECQVSRFIDQQVIGSVECHKAGNMRVLWCVLKQSHDPQRMVKVDSRISR